MTAGSLGRKRRDALMSFIGQGWGGGRSRGRTEVGEVRSTWMDRRAQARGGDSNLRVELSLGFFGKRWGGGGVLVLSMCFGVSPLPPLAPLQPLTRCGRGLDP